MADCSQRRDDSFLQIRLRKGHIRFFSTPVSKAYKTPLLLPECFDYASEVNRGSLSINYDVFCVL